MIGTVAIDGKVYPLVEAELRLPLMDQSRWMYLTASGESGGFGMWDVEFALLERLDNLNGKRMHVYPSGETYEDDSLGTDITGMYETTDINYAKIGETSYIFGEIQIDFECIDGLTYRCRVMTSVTDDCSIEQDAPAESFPLRMTADFIVTIDEHEP